LTTSAPTAPTISPNCAACWTRWGNLYRSISAWCAGIDYYTKTVFEVWAEGIGAQAAVCGGGRYDGLAEAIGGPSTPGVGFGSGIERIVLGMKEQNSPAPAPPRRRCWWLILAGKRS
jgi:histidyl-tRNA synthetase